MRILKSLITLLLITFSIGLFAQSNKDIIYLKDGSKLNGEIVEYSTKEDVKIKVGSQVITITQDEIRRIVRGNVKSRETDNIEVLDIVYLKDGTTYSGKIQDLKRKEYVEILVNGELMHFEDEEVRRVVSAVPQTERIARKKVRESIDPSKLTTKGFYNAAYLSFSYGESLGGEFSIGAGIHLVFGKQIDEMKGFGIGLGIDSYKPSRGQTVYPLYLDYRMYPFKENKSYYLDLGAGYGFAFKNAGRGIREARGGLYASPVVGYRTSSKDGSSLNLELGYKYQKAYFEEESARTFNDIEINDLNFQRIVFKVGIMFWSGK